MSIHLVLLLMQAIKIGIHGTSPNVLCCSPYPSSRRNLVADFSHSVA